MPINNWMKSLSGDLTLDQIVMPGSHDAGMWVVTGAGAGYDTCVITQGQDVTGQLNSGCRFFDFRIFNRTSAFKTTADHLFFGHFAETTGRGRAITGRYGAKVIPVFQAIKTWIQDPANTDEVVFLRFSHIRSANRDVVIKTVRKELKDVLLTTHKTTMINLASAKLSSMRGKVVAIFDVGDGFTRDAPKGIRTYKSHKKQNVIPDHTKELDLQLCGEFSDKNNYRQMYPLQQARHSEHTEHVKEYEPHLHVIYFTFTSGRKNIETMTAQYRDKLDGFLNEFITLRAKDDGCNIVMMDFISDDKSILVVNKGNGLQL